MKIQVILFLVLLLIESIAFAKMDPNALIREEEKQQNLSSNGILLNRKYIAEHINTIEEKQIWNSIQPNGGDYIIEKVHIHLKEEYVGCAEGSTVFEVQTEPSSVFLFRGTQIQEGDIIKSYKNLSQPFVFSEMSPSISIPYDSEEQHIKILLGITKEKQPILPGYPISISNDQGKNISLNLYGTLDIVLDFLGGEGQRYYKISGDTQLVVKVGTSDIILSPKEVYDDVSEAEFRLPDLLWAGDINNDGYPDLLINYIEGYYGAKDILFISSSKEGIVSYTKFAERSYGYGC